MAERNELLKTLDVDKMIKFLKRNGMNPFGYYDKTNVLAGMHKARCLMRSFSDSERALSQQWLRDNGFKVPRESLPVRN